jgi:hypothetical protein
MKNCDAKLLRLLHPESRILRRVVLGLTFCVLIASEMAQAAAVNTKLAAATTTLSSTAAGAPSNYTLKTKTKNKNGADIAVGNTVTFTFPVGTNAATITSATFAGTTVPFGSITASATSISFPAPTSVNKNTNFTTVMNGITNPTVIGSYRASLVTGNSSGGLNTGTNIFVYTIVAGAPTKLGFKVQPVNTAAGASIFPAVQVSIQDSIGNTVTTSNAPVTIAIANNAGGGTLGGTLTVNAVNGVAIFSNLKINAAGTGYTLTATSGVLTAATSNAFNILASTANHLSFFVQPTDATAGASIAPAIQVEVQDTFGNRLTSASDSITLGIGNNPGGGTLSGTTTVNASNGLATFSGLSIDKAGAGYTLTASAAGPLSGTSSTFAINAGTAAKLGFVGQPTDTAAGDATTNAIFPDVQVAIQDSLGNTVTSAPVTNITIVIGTNAGGGTLTGTLSANTASGVATFSDLHINKVGTGYTLSASGTFTAGVSATFNITPDIADTLVFKVAPSNTQAGASIFPAVEVEVQDAFGNAVTTATDSITITKAPAGGVLSGTLTQSAVNGTGVATFNDLAIDTVNTYTLSAAATNLTGVTSGNFNITAATGNHLVFSVQPGNVTAGANFGSTVQVTIKDQFNNTANATDSITLAIGNNPGGATLSGTVTVAAVAGVADFPGISLDKAGSGYGLTASGTGLSGATSNSFQVSAAALDHFLVEASGGGAIGTQTAGAPFSLRITAQDQFNNTATSFVGTTQLTSNAALSGTPVSTPAFTAGVLSSQSVTITSAQGGTTLTATEVGGTGKIGTSAGFTVSPGTLDHFLVEASGGGNIGTQAVGTAFTLKITAQDSSNNTVPSFTGTVQVTSNATLTGAPLTTGSFTAGVLASQSVTITSAQAGTTLTVSGLGKIGTSNGFTVNAGALDHFLVEASGGGAIGTQAAGTAFNIKITAQDVSNNTATSFVGTVQITSNATLTGTPVTSATFTAGVLSSQSVTITSAQGGTTLTATASGKTGTSNTFTVSIGAAAKLAFSVQPGNSEAGGAITPAPKVTVQDAAGNTITGATTSITIAIGNNAGTGTLSGTVTVAAVSGVATFSGLSIDKVGTGYTLTASASGLTSATSSAFNITDSSAPVVVSQPSAGVPNATVGDTVTFTFVVSDASAVTYTWDFGDGTVVTTTSTSVTHVFTAPATYPVTVTATDAGGQSTSATTNFQVNAAASASTDICAGLNPIELRVQQISAKLKFPSTLSKDSLSLKALIQLNDGFNPLGQSVQWDIAGIGGTTTLDAKGNSPVSTSLKVSVKFKKPAKGLPFTARPAKLSISIKNTNLSLLKLGGITNLNSTSASTKGDSAKVEAHVVLKNHQAYHKLENTGTYKSKQDKGGSFSAKFLVK